MIVSIPVWGEAYLERLGRVAPSIRASLADRPARIICHTDQPDRVRALLSGFEVEIRPVPPGQHYAAFATAHREVIDRADLGETVILLAADLAPSIEAIDFCETTLASGYRLVLCPGLRTLSKASPPVADKAALAAWALANLHPSMAQNFYGESFPGVPWGLFFRCAGGIVLRAFHLHPLAFVKTRELAYGGTVDAGLPGCFDRTEAFVADHRHFCMVECSPPEHARYPSRLVGPKWTVQWAKEHASPTHRWLFAQHRLVIEGDPGPGPDTAYVRDVMALLGWREASL